MIALKEKIIIFVQNSKNLNKKFGIFDRARGFYVFFLKKDFYRFLSILIQLGILLIVAAQKPLNAFLPKSLAKYLFLVTP